MSSQRSFSSAAVLGAALCAVLAAGCSKPAATAPAPADVQVATVTVQDVPITREWIGTLDGFVNAQIRAQVSGYLVRQDYREGAAVKRGDPLFDIDDRPFKAALEQSEGALAQARAQLEKAKLDVARDTPLVAQRAVSQQELDDAVQALAAASAQVKSAEAAAEQARLNLSFAHITSPIDGIAGLVQGQIGDLVGPSTGVLTTVSTIDPIKAYFPISEQAYLEFTEHRQGGSPVPAGIAFDLVLSDGSTDPLKGTFFALDRQVAGDTGTIRTEALFPNPDLLLRPGQYARVRAVVKVDKGALTVPLRAVSELQGGYQMAKVDATGHVHFIAVKAGATIGSSVEVTGDLHPGDQVIVEGLQKVKEGDPVNETAFAAPASAK